MSTGNFNLIDKVNHKKNKEKNLQQLLGILKGMSADGPLVEKEIFYLKHWLKDEEIHKNDGDFLDLSHMLSEVIEDGKFSQEVLDDLNQLIIDIIQYNQVGLDTEKAEINQFIGILSGLAADNSMNIIECRRLAEFLSTSEILRDYFLGRAITPPLLKILSKPQPKKKDYDDLLLLIKQLSGNMFIDTGYVVSMPIHLTTDTDEIYDIESLVVCFTGVFQQTRSETERVAKVLGAIPVPRVIQDLDMLVIGGDISSHWAHGNFGRKIETAMKFIEDGFRIKIINEAQWLKITRQCAERIVIS